MIWRRWPDFLALRAPKICKDLQIPELFFCESIARFTALHGELHLHDGAQRDPPKRCLRNFRWQGTMSGSLANARALYFRSLLDPPPIGGLGRHPGGGWANANAMGAAAGGHNVQGHAWTRWAADLHGAPR